MANTSKKKGSNRASRKKAAKPKKVAKKMKKPAKKKPSARKIKESIRGRSKPLEYVGTTRPEDDENLIVYLDPVSHLRPAYLNTFRNTARYQISLGKGAYAGSKKPMILPTVRDMLVASDLMKLVFPDSTSKNDIPAYEVEYQGQAQYVKFITSLFRSESMRVVGARDLIYLQRHENKEAYTDVYSPEVVMGYLAALRRLAVLDDIADQANPDNKEKFRPEEERDHAPEAIQEADWCRDELTDFVKSKDGLDALDLWIKWEGEGEPRIRSVKDAEQATEYIFKFLMYRIGDQQKQMADYRQMLLGND